MDKRLEKKKKHYEGKYLVAIKDQGKGILCWKPYKIVNVTTELCEKTEYCLEFIDENDIKNGLYTTFENEDFIVTTTKKDAKIALELYK